MLDSVEVKEISHDGVNFCCLPGKATEKSAGYDLYAALSAELILKAGGGALIPAGISVHIRDGGYFGLVAARSGLANKYGVTLKNGVGIIDADYTGEIYVALINLSENDYTICPGDRIAQLLFIPAASPVLVQVAEFSESSARGVNGFGSTGR